jgi:long-chain fatty acid transport protein
LEDCKITEKRVYITEFGTVIALIFFIHEMVMMGLQIRRWVCVSVGLCFLIGAGKAHASGFGVFTHGAHALGKSNAVTAHNESPSTVFFNPALINNLPGTQVEIGTTMIAIRQDFTSAATGMEIDGAEDEFFPSSLFLTHSVSSKFSLGFGIFNPFGLATQWPDDWEGRYLSTKSEMTTFNFNPVVSWRVTPEVSVAAGAAFLTLDATLESKLNMALLGFPAGFTDGHQKFEGDGQGVGYNLGLSAKLNDKLSLGVSYRSAIDVTADGQVSTQLPPGSGAVAPLFPTTGGETKITLPRQISAGIAYQISPKAGIETGVRWEEWSSFDELRITFNRPVAGQTQRVTPRDWDDTFAVNIGGRYNFTDKYALLLGFLYENNPVPDDTFEPAIPGSDSYLYSIGMIADYEKFAFSISYGLQWKESRTKNNAISALDGSTANGEYNAILHLLGGSFSYRF